MSSRLNVAEQKRGTIVALLLALIVLGFLLAAAAVHGGIAWLGLPVYLIGGLIGGRLSARIFTFNLAVAQEEVRLRALAELSSAGGFRQLADAGTAAAESMRAALTVTTTTEPEDR